MAMESFKLVRKFEGRKLAEAYSKHRPTYPAFIAESIIQFVRSKNPSKPQEERFSRMIDVGCGGGKSTHMFAPYFDSILGIDISEGQIEVAKEFNKNDNVSFQLVHDNFFPAEDSSVDLICSGTAVHWFDMKVFVSECERVLKPDGCVAIYTSLPNEIKSVNGGEFDPKFIDLQVEFFKNCNAHEATYVWRDGYRSLFDDISNKTKKWLKNETLELEYSLKEFVSYYSTVGEYHMMMHSGKSEYDPLPEFSEGIKKLLGEEKIDDEDVRFIVKIEYPVIVFTKC